MLYIGEFSTEAFDARNQPVDAPMMPPAAQQVLQIGIGPEFSEPFHSNTKFIVLTAIEDCYIDIGPEPKPENRLMFLPAGLDRKLGVQAGHRLGVIAAEFIT